MKTVQHPIFHFSAIHFNIIHLYRSRISTGLVYYFHINIFKNVFPLFALHIRPFCPSCNFFNFVRPSKTRKRTETWSSTLGWYLIHWLYPSVQAKNFEKYFMKFDFHVSNNKYYFPWEYKCANVLAIQGNHFPPPEIIFPWLTSKFQTVRTVSPSRRR
jgi:hypothetical protein